MFELSQEQLEDTPEQVKEEAMRLLKSPELLDVIAQDGADLGIVGELVLFATLYLVGTSRFLRKPLAAIVQGSSSSGKSYVTEVAAKLFPEETKVIASQISPQALFYLPPGSLCHRLVVAGERSRNTSDEAADVTRALREMLSSGEVSKLVTEPGGSGQFSTRHVNQRGPIAYVETTSLTQVFSEDANRCLLLTTDERPEQTARIVQRLAEDASGKDRVSDKTTIIQKHHALQRLLKPVEVVVPYAEMLGERFPNARVECRRAFPHFLQMIQAGATLHQFQRQRDSSQRVVATAEDYEIALKLLEEPLGRSLGNELSASVKSLLEALQDKYPTEEFTTADASNAHGKACRRTVHAGLNELAQRELVVQVEPHKGPNPAVWTITPKAFGPAPAGKFHLPTLREVEEYQLANKA